MYMAKMCGPPTNIKLITYADDSTVLFSGPKINPLCVSLNKYLDTLNTWFKSRNLQICASKSMATIFTTASNEVGRKLPISIDGVQVPTHKDPKVFGVILDPLLTFNQYAKSVKEKVNKRNNILKALAGSAWGIEKEILLTLTRSSANQS